MWSKTQNEGRGRISLISWVIWRISVQRAEVPFSVKKKATIGHVGNDLLNGFAHNVEQYIVYVTFWVEEFIIDIVLMIQPIFDLSAQKGPSFKVVIEPSY